jgi:hypothetical protein
LGRGSTLAHERDELGDCGQGTPDVDWTREFTEKRREEKRFDASLLGLCRYCTYLDVFFFMYAKFACLLVFDRGSIGG